MHQLPHRSFSVRSFAPKASLTCIALIVVGIVTGCAATGSPSYYDPPKPSSTQDAILQAEGAGTRQMVQAPSQVQIRWNSKDPSQNQVSIAGTQVQDSLTPAGKAQMKQELAQDAAPQGLIIAQPETFMGTLPCFHRDMRCTAQRVTLTLAPNGRWRARVDYLDQKADSGQAMTSQGCWRGLPTRPAQIVLLDANKNVRAELLMTSREILRLRSIDGQTPNLVYTLNRQPDLDPIAELDKQPAPICN